MNLKIALAGFISPGRSPKPLCDAKNVNVAEYKVQVRFDIPHKIGVQVVRDERMQENKTRRVRNVS